MKERTCKYCGCTDLNCSQCIKRTGSPCYWITEDVCSACDEKIISSHRNTTQQILNIIPNGIKLAGNIFKKDSYYYFTVILEKEQELDFKKSLFSCVSIEFGFVVYVNLKIHQKHFTYETNTK